MVGLLALIIIFIASLIFLVFYGFMLWLFCTAGFACWNDFMTAVKRKFSKK